MVIDNVSPLFDMCRGAADRFHGLNYQLLGRLPWAAEKVEAAIGLSPLPAVEPKPTGSSN